MSQHVPPYPDSPADGPDWLDSDSRHPASSHWASLLVVLPGDLSQQALRELLVMHGIEVRRFVCHAPVLDQPVPQLVVRLTRMELQVLKCFTCCDRDNEIAAELHISVRTVQTHVRNLYAKLHVSSRAHAIGRAVRLGLLRPDDLLSP